MSNRKVISFKPIYDKRSKVLILGTSPGKKSEQYGFYYANTLYNAFWEIMNEGFGITIPDNKETAISKSYKELLNNQIAVWDVNSWNVYFENSSKDKDIIKEGPFNDIFNLLNNSNIKVIILNGQKAFKQFIKMSKKFNNLPNFLYLECTAAGWSNSSRVKNKKELKKLWIDNIRNNIDKA